MSFLTRALGAEERSLNGVSPDAWGRGLDVLFGSTTSRAAGVRVDRSTALGLSAVYSCVTLLSDLAGSFPAALYAEDGPALVPLGERPAWLDEPAPQAGIGWSEFVSSAVTSLLLTGDVIAAVHRGPTGQVEHLELLDPDRVHVAWDGPRRRYEVGGVELPAELVLHVPGLVVPGQPRGLSPIRAAEVTIGAGLAAQTLSASWYRNGSHPASVVEVPGTPSEEGVRLMKQGFEAIHRGVDRAGGLAVLTEGAKLAKVGISPVDVQLVEARAYTVADISRIFHVPGHLLNLEGTTSTWGAGIAEQNLAFLTYSVRPLIGRIEAALTRLRRSEGRPGVVRFDTTDLTRGAPQAQVDTLTKAIDAGLLTRDEARAVMGRAPLGAEQSASRELAEVLQKIYLSVGSVVTADEARMIANAAGADLTVPGPTLSRKTT